MKSVQDVRATIGNIPYMTLEQTESMTRHIFDKKIRSILELGFFHGASTCYMVNAISDHEDGHIVAIDREDTKWGFAQKLVEGGSGPARIETKVVIQERRVGLGGALIKLSRRLGMR